MSFPQSGESTFPDSRNPVRMDTEDQSFAGKPSHGSHGTHGTHPTTTTNNNNDSTFVEVMPLTSAPLVHHVHRDNEPLPGAKGGAKTFDYSPENIENADNLPTGSGQSQPFRSGEQTATGGHANTARAYGGSTTETSGDFRGPTIASTMDRHDAGTSNFASGQNDNALFAKEGTNNTESNRTHDLHKTHGTSSRVPEPVGDLKPHTGNNNASVGRTDNYNTVSAAGNHDLNHPSHHAGVTGGPNKTPYDGAGNGPTNKPSLGDKIIGKTEQVCPS